MSYLILCAGDRSKYKVALSILKYFFKEHRRDKENIFVCVSDGDKDICNFLKKKKINFTNKNIKSFLKDLKTDKYKWLLNIWCPIIHKKEILQKFKNNLNIHPSYLPFAKGKDPYVWSVQKQYPLGVTIHEMNEKIDSGKFFIQKKIYLDFPYTGGDVFDCSLKECIELFKNNWKKIRENKIKKKELKKTKTKTFKRGDLVNRNLLDLDKKNNSNIKKFIYTILSQDFKFNKLQLKINNYIYDASLNLKKNKKKQWK
ncbi:formyltransferase family protein [Candidatus Pelagibacter sp.]|nr:formyltransferase family protein [Candidatus Pelagibacter sp.]